MDTTKPCLAVVENSVVLVVPDPAGPLDVFCSCAPSRKRKDRSCRHTDVIYAALSATERARVIYST